VSETGLFEVCFVCTGNFYRSRFAEEYFEHRARIMGISAQASSRGLLDPVAITRNKGPLSPLTRDELDRLGVPAPDVERFPVSLVPEDVARADLVVYMDAAQHAPMVEARQDITAEGARFWDIRDFDLEPSETALGRTRERVDALLDELSNL